MQYYCHRQEAWASASASQARCFPKLSIAALCVMRYGHSIKVWKGEFSSLAVSRKKSGNSEFKGDSVGSEERTARLGDSGVVR